MKVNMIAFLLPILLSNGLFAQNLSNRDLEDWTLQSFGGSTWEDPDGWDTPNSGTVLLGLKLVHKEESHVQNGSYAAKLVTSEIPLLLINAPSALTTGTLVPNLSDPTNTLLIGGAPMHERATSLTGYYDYQPMGGDSMTAWVRMLYIDGADTIKISEDEITDDQNSGGYIFFEIPINFWTTDIPDLIQVLFRSTRNTLDAHVGSTLYVDNLSLTGVTSAIAPNEAGFKADLYPNPAADVFNVRMDRNQGGLLYVFDSTGRLVIECPLTAGLNSIPVHDLNSGLYLYQIQGKTDGLYSGKLSIQH